MDIFGFAVTLLASAVGASQRGLMWVWQLVAGAAACRPPIKGRLLYGAPPHLPFAERPMCFPLQVTIPDSNRDFLVS